MKTIGIIENNPKTLQMLSAMVRHEPWLQLVSAHTNACDFIEFCQNSLVLPEIVLVDVNMEMMDGVALTDFVSDHFGQIKVIGVSNYPDKQAVEDMLSCGAWGYVTKINIVCLMEAIKTVIGENPFLDPYIDQRITPRDELIAQRSQQKLQKKAFHLTNRESTLLALNATGISTGQIARLLFIQPKTVNNIFTNISKKMNVTNRLSMALMAIRLGLVKLARLTPSLNSEKKLSGRK